MLSGKARGRRLRASSLTFIELPRMAGSYSCPGPVSCRGSLVAGGASHHKRGSFAPELLAPFLQKLLSVADNRRPGLVTEVDHRNFREASVARQEQYPVAERIAG